MYLLILGEERFAMVAKKNETNRMNLTLFFLIPLGKMNFGIGLWKKSTFLFLSFFSNLSYGIIYSKDRKQKN